MTPATPERAKRAATVGERIRALRKEHGVSQKDLARWLKIRRTDLSDYERGEHEPHPLRLMAIGERFGIDNLAYFYAPEEDDD